MNWIILITAGLFVSKKTNELDHFNYSRII